MALATLIAPAAIAQEASYTFDIPSQPLADALRAYGQTTGEQIVFRDAEIGARQSAALVGSYTSNDALTRLLDGSGLIYTRRASGVLVVQDPNSPTQLGDAGRAAPSEDGETDLVVTGTRIRGAPPSVPVITVSNEDMRNAGQNDLGEVIRSIPQNFGGGQNPGVGNSQGAFGNVNVQGASSLNLRGMGPDATLTLLNGSRLAYNGLNAAVDISAIPSAAVSRVEILPDGASALYGSDAVAGVANIVLRRDFEGAQVSARFGAATDGGGEQQQYGA
ncbi:MAG TPA: TonB-dependent receptor, partial [Verrucomicrobiae bacterium]|nr:TonB-dependent receptor [Verrucomicrobiae bacterium]